ncbi:MAG: sigma-54 dependent transcriptional regulator [Acidobacteriota bacterium]|nr:sigma-54 dependent transcriptional regulator [Acidobacteriota bacterium]
MSGTGRATAGWRGRSRSDAGVALILVVDDEPGIRQMLEAVLRAEGHRVVCMASPTRALQTFEDETVDLVITDLAMPEMNGVMLLRRVAEISPDTPSIVITAYGSKETAIDAMRHGAVNYLEKPFDVEEMRLHVRHALGHRRLSSENRQLKLRLSLDERMIGNSPAMRGVRDLVGRIGSTDSTVLITGESGTGKELVARSLHAASGRAARPFVGINCGAIPPELLESELFGHERGAFTGADKARPGLIETAEGGTLFLDEIGDMPAEMQVKLLRVLQERRIRKVGGAEEIPVDVRVLTATHRELDKLVAAGRFREDLYYRIHVIRIELPALRDRKEDIPEFARRFSERHAIRMHREISGIEPGFLEPLMRHDWPGNVRELENVIERAVALASGPILTRDLLPPNLTGRAAAPGGVGEIPDDFDLERHIEAQRCRLMEQALIESSGVQTRAAERLGMSFRSFRYFAKKYELTGRSSETCSSDSASEPIGARLGGGND